MTSFTSHQFASSYDVDFAIQAIQFANPAARITAHNDIITVECDEYPQVAGKFTSHQFASSYDVDFAIQAIQFANPAARITAHNDIITVECVAFVNVTPHPLNIKNAAGEIVTIPPSGIVARCAQVNTQLLPIGGFPLVLSTFGDVEDLPEQKDYHILIASRLVISALKGTRPDVVGVGEAIRDDKGNVIGANGFAI